MRMKEKKMTISLRESSLHFLMWQGERGFIVLYSAINTINHLTSHLLPTFIFSSFSHSRSAAGTADKMTRHDNSCTTNLSRREREKEKEIQKKEKIN